MFTIMSNGIITKMVKKINFQVIIKYYAKKQAIVAKLIQKQRIS